MVGRIYLIYGCKVPIRRFVWFLVQAGDNFEHLYWCARGPPDDSGLVEYNSITPEVREMDGTLLQRGGEIISYSEKQLLQNAELRNTRPSKRIRFDNRWSGMNDDDPSKRIRLDSRGSEASDDESLIYKDFVDDAYCWDECSFRLPDDLGGVCGQGELGSRMYVRSYPRCGRPANKCYPDEYAVVVGVLVRSYDIDSVQTTLLADIQHAQTLYLDLLGQLAGPPQDQMLTLTADILPTQFSRDLRLLVLSFLIPESNQRLLAALLRSCSNTAEAFAIPNICNCCH